MIAIQLGLALVLARDGARYMKQLQFRVKLIAKSSRALSESLTLAIGGSRGDCQCHGIALDSELVSKCLV